MPELHTGAVFAGHRIEGLAGRGGMGVVYRATQLALDRLVALKVIAPALAEEPDFRRRFVAESKAAASIEHPNVIPIYYAGERDGVLFIAMRYVDGVDLRGLMRADGRVEPGRAARIVAQVGAALDAAHARGLVHRDVKPANVLLGDGDHAYLTDFGLTKRVASHSALSRSGGWVGTLGYVSPEQIRDERVDARSDVYALGCVLVHALTGRAPFVRDSDEATLYAHLGDAPPGAAEGVPEAFCGVVARALAKDPARRYPSAGDLGRAVLAAAGSAGDPGPERVVARGAAAAAGDDTRPSPTTATAPATGPATATRVTTRDDGPRSRPGRRGRLAGLGAAGVIVLAAAGALVLAVSGSPQTPDERPAPPGTGAPAASGTARLGPEVPVARPNALTIAGGLVWVASQGSSDLAIVDAESAERVRPSIDVGEGAAAIASGFDSVWVAKQGTGNLLRISVRSRQRRGDATALPAGDPVAVAAAEGAVWVGLRATPDGDGPGSVVKLDPRTGAIEQQLAVPGGLQDLAVGEDAVWVTNRGAATVTRIGIADGRRSTIRVGRRPAGIAVGEGAVWVAAMGDDALTRIDAGDRSTTTIALRDMPNRVAVGGGSVWVTARASGTLTRVDARTREVDGAPLRIGPRPFALDATRNTVWVGLVNDEAVRRVDF